MKAGLKWVQPSARRYEYVLVSGDKAIGALAWKSWHDSLAFAEAPEGRWTFKQVGFWQSKSTIRVAGDDADAGLFESGWSEAGTLRLGGKSFKWRPANSWYTKWEFADEDGAVVRFKSTHKLLKKRGRSRGREAGSGGDAACIVWLVRPAQYDRELERDGRHRQLSSLALFWHCSQYHF